MAVTERPSLQVRRSFSATPERLFQAWTDPALLQRWFAPANYTVPAAEVDLSVGGRYRIEMQAPNGTIHRVTGVYREISPPRKLVFTWYWETDPSRGDTLVTVELQQSAGTTDVVLTHEWFPDEELRDRHQWGWTSCLDNLQGVL